MHYLYLITRDDGEKYVGVTTHLSKRMREHRNGYGSKHLYNRKFSYIVLESGDEETIYGLEDAAIHAHEASLNIAKGGTGGFKLDQVGSANNRAKLIDEDVLAIRNFAYNNPKVPYSVIAAKYNVVGKTISDICLGRDWAHVGGPLIPNKKDHMYPKQGTKDDILRLYKEGTYPTEISDILGFDRSAVYRELRNQGITLLQDKKARRQINMQKVAELYNKGERNWTRMSKEVGVSRTSCRNYAKELGLL